MSRAPRSVGQEIESNVFSQEAFAEFRRRLDVETRLLADLVEKGALDSDEYEAGSELEAWLVDDAGRPAPVNPQLLDVVDEPWLVPELSSFNVELNTTPVGFTPGMLERMHAELVKRWGRCQEAASGIGAHMVMIGILPSIERTDLCLANLSAMRRYRALNEQIFRLRAGSPIEVDIEGRERLQLLHTDVMLEAATTSFQLHIKIPLHHAVRAFNVSKILSAPMVAACANSPFLFGRDLWDETRIPMFEQSVSVGGSDYSKRVTFGIRYAHDSLLEVFEANRDRYPILLPQLMDEPPERFAHLRLHNGTIWRWNRPLIGFSDDGRPHFRIEHRVVPSGPSPTDCVANAALYFGALTSLLESSERLEDTIPFTTAIANFYAAAREGLRARIKWRDGVPTPAAAVLVHHVLPLAREGLSRMGLGDTEIRDWLGVVEERVTTGRNGAAWQRAWVVRHGTDSCALVRAYRERQERDLPVHTWNF